MSIAQQLRRLAAILDELPGIDLGYPLGDNRILPPDPEAAANLSEAGMTGVEGLRELYLACDGISLPDIHTGYFIKPLRNVLTYGPASEPRTVLLENEIPVLSIGSTGGGGLFAAERRGGRVFHLPPGPLHEGVYDGRSSQIVAVAGGIAQFIDRIVIDVEAFVYYDQSHRYLVDP